MRLEKAVDAMRRKKVACVIILFRDRFACCRT
jgi:hypothetical protein